MHMPVTLAPPRTNQTRRRYSPAPGIGDIFPTTGPSQVPDADGGETQVGNGANSPGNTGNLPSVWQAQLDRMLPHGFAGNGTPVIFMAPPPEPPAERNRRMFSSAFYATAGIGSALLLVTVGFCIVLAGVSLWRDWGTTTNAAPPPEIAIAPSGEVAASPQLHLDCGVDGDSMLRVSANNRSFDTLSDVVVMLDDSDKPNAPLATLKVGQLSAGQIKTVFKPVPGLRQLAQAGRARIRLAPAKDSALPKDSPAL